MTSGDFESDAVAFEIESGLIASGVLQVELDFPYPPIHTTRYKYEVFVGVYDFPLNHTTSIAEPSETMQTGGTHIYHEMQETKYFVNLRWPSGSALCLSKDQSQGSTAATAHRYTLGLAQHTTHNASSSSLSFTALFSKDRYTPDLPSAIRQRNAVGWHDYWNEGAFVDLTESSNPNSTELQRRIILSQYHVRVNSAATGQSPQESGLMNNGWYGK